MVNLGEISMLVKEISFVRPNLLEDEDYNLDVFVELENGYTCTVGVATAKNIMSFILNLSTNLDRPIIALS